jgi:hypothetical protein
VLILLALLGEKPAIQFFTGGFDISSLALDGHTLGCPTLRDRDWLSEKSRDLLPSFENVCLCLQFLSLYHGSSTMLSGAAGLQAGSLYY